MKQREIRRGGHWPWWPIWRALLVALNGNPLHRTHPDHRAYRRTLDNGSDLP